MSNENLPILGTDVEDYARLAAMTDDERAQWPYAVGVRLPIDETTTVTRYSDVHAAAMMAHLMDTPGNVVTRWVAVDGPEWSRTTPVPGWRRVTYFNDVD